jgi:hypothetical protein
LRLALVTLLVCALPTFAATDEEKVDRLKSHLSGIRAQARMERGVNAILSVAVGSTGVLGYFLARKSTIDDRRATLAPFLGITGALFVISGVLEATMPSDYENLPAQFEESNGSPLPGRISLGEQILEDLGQSSRRRRFIQSGVLGALGAGQLIWYAASGARSDRSWMIYGGIAGLTLGVMSLLSPRHAEASAKSYFNWSAAPMALNGAPGATLFVQF